MKRVLLVVHGIVQGVGYRAFVRSAASRLGIRGFVRNMPDGSVEILAEADSQSLDAFERQIDLHREECGPQVFNIEKRTGKEMPYELANMDLSGFEVVDE